MRNPSTHTKTISFDKQLVAVVVVDDDVGKITRGLQAYVQTVLVIKQGQATKLAC